MRRRAGHPRGAAATPLGAATGHHARVNELPIRFGSPLAGLAVLRDATSRRSSSWDRSGGNDDRAHLQPGEEVVLLDAPGPGCVRHVWVTLGSDEPEALRKVVLRAWWDDEPEPSV